MYRAKPELNFFQIFNMCFGFLGIQMGFALQNANVSRIFETLGADYNNLAILWIAAPLTGLVVQPIIGHMSDNTWNKLGRRRPYFLYGAIAASLALIAMPNSPYLWVAAGMLWIMDAAINVSMEPFRAFVGDMLPKEQRATGFSMQSFFIGIGGTIASAMPWILANWLDVSNTAEPGVVPDSVKFSFYFGAVAFFLAVGWTIWSTKEYSPEELDEFAAAEKEAEDKAGRAHAVQIKEHVTHPAEAYLKGGVIWLIIGLVLTAIIQIFSASLDKKLFILSGVLAAFGALQLLAGMFAKQNKADNGFNTMMDDLFNMPDTMKQLAWVQFFSWFPLFAMWIYTTAAVTSHHYHTSDPSSTAYNEGANWVGVLFGGQFAFAALAAVVIPILVKATNLRITHLINLFLGALGFLSFLLIDNPNYLIYSMVGIGFAWASILSIPYTLLANSLPQNKMGIFMGIFNFFITLPQLVAASILGFMVTRIFDGEPIYALLIAAISMAIAGLLTLRVREA
ncbi:MFS transporter [Planctobacterium marinum]|uniref:MFS transporter n=1 Tax=Planctobacterium marinum TaxID=1631968 RepID=A0AA48KS25_9ALTE|nr:MFS transporter [Planctobacterium marinum]